MEGKYTIRTYNDKRFEIKISEYGGKIPGMVYMMRKYKFEVINDKEDIIKTLMSGDLIDQLEIETDEAVYVS